MPLYEYRCQQCKSGFTELRRSSEMDSQIDCPECCSRETQRSISSFTVGGASAGMPSATASAGSQFN
ncbi:MAG TPA: zinc ribbon domain-containing protein [Candidatus Lambdaproteobacteria bacterium]|nr:zinc ribbon domain-containing protein [SAR324 cluster bacterium]HBL55143.1 zinc ribbon domain-containing protein [Deltaproteobacteria bacterium]HHZ86534.1 zinc ribbon domain-containing protein [Candidatus Lambdaproteobacteria bacterium]HIA57332.1 zinc ribbon domain-containing protein [Candidatus Lambdaproteobacteria bacterium]HIB46476.1 zinc ribbon domain-containing protein [Candidatus Lambdaproteobacteria bacterium]